MTSVTVDLPVELYERLSTEANALGTSLQALARGFLTARFAHPSMAESEQVAEVLQAIGLLTELGAEEKQRAMRSTATLMEVRAALDRAGGQPLSETIMEMRGPKM